MKKLLAIFATLIISLSVQADPYKEGVNYEVLDLPHSSNPTVTEYFSFYCPHCFEFEPVIQKLKSHLPEGTEFQKNHVSFMGGNMGASMSKAYATMMSLGVEDKMIPVMFNRIHIERNAPKNDAALKQIFVDQGVDAKKFDATFNSFAVDSMARRFDKGFAESKLTGVPSVIVNNKYLVITRGIKNNEDYFKLVDFLLKK
ncbi:Thiol:disulfide interchange protein DsbA precursor [Vibrio aerogenes CECT 7868]|uniref:Thiol:disulfide interchange protein n=1 Tax=Vibrio aerogenes CECT 7868 TaxID=1216006 RepID=A0A1M6EPI7_9VIBR|nr:thiol:disulfide interchange protein DsbA/DsbL [Vibrio aerogenes]SHI87427.1 Thiol:disulfide interchange protein DsbA precursor [Vibrio aerogenes CECT 7868]